MCAPYDMISSSHQDNNEEALQYHKSYSGAHSCTEIFRHSMDPQKANHTTYPIKHLLTPFQSTIDSIYLKTQRLYYFI